MTTRARWRRALCRQLRTFARQGVCHLPSDRPNDLFQNCVVCNMAMHAAFGVASLDLLPDPWFCPKCTFAKTSKKINSVRVKLTD